MNNRKSKGWYGDPQIDAVLDQKPEHRRRESSGDLLDDKIVGILIGYSVLYKARHGHIDLITTGKASEEIKQLIIDCGGDPSKLERMTVMDQMHKIKWIDEDGHSAQGAWTFPELEDEANFINLSQAIPEGSML